MNQRKLSEIAQIIMGQSPNSDTYNENSEGIPFFQGKSDFGEINPTIRMYCSKPIKLADKNDILMSVRAPVGDVNISNIKCCIGRGLSAIRCYERIDHKYVYYYLANMKEKFEEQATGSTFKAISKSIIENMSIWIPEKFEEQKKISRILDKAQELIDKRRCQIKDLDELVKSRFIEMFGDPYKNSKGWAKRKLGEVCILNPKKSELNVKDNFEVSFVPMMAVSENGDIDTSDIRSYGEVKTGFTYFIENDVLFAKITPCMENGKGAIARGLKNGIGFGTTEFHVLRPQENIIDSQWLYTLTALDMFRHDAERKMTGSAGQKRVPIKFFDDFKIGIPPIDLQSQFAIFVQQVDKLKFEMQNSLEEMENNFNSLMQRAFKGELFN